MKVIKENYLMMCEPLCDTDARRRPASRQAHGWHSNKVPPLVMTEVKRTNVPSDRLFTQPPPPGTSEEPWTFIYPFAVVKMLSETCDDLTTTAGNGRGKGRGPQHGTISRSKYTPLVYHDAFWTAICRIDLTSVVLLAVFLSSPHLRRPRTQPNSSVRHSSCLWGGTFSLGSHVSCDLIRATFGRQNGNFLPKYSGFLTNKCKSL